MPNEKGELTQEDREKVIKVNAAADVSGSPHEGVSGLRERF